MNSPSTYRDKLKAATAKQHRELESIMEINKLLSSPTPDRIHYSCLLRTHYKFLIVLEYQDYEGTKEFGKKLNKKRLLLEQDLGNLQQSLNLVPQRKEFMNEAYKIGWYYVAMGSQLGNRVLFKQLEKHPIFRQWQASQFLGYNAADSWDSWKALIQRINNLKEQEYLNVENGAIDAFVHFKSIWKDEVTELQVEHYLIKNRPTSV